MRIVFMGTPQIAETVLVELLRRPELEVVGVFTRPDKPVGRKQVITPSPVKVRAAENRIPVCQPKTLRSEEAVEQLRALAPDLVVVVAYGLLLPPEVLALPRYGCINLHVSLLPRYRGAAPIQWAVINGEEKTGVSVMQMDEGLDTGPVLGVRPVEIALDATSGEVFELVGHIGARFLCEVVEDIRQGRAKAEPQAGESSYAPPLKKSDGLMDFTCPAAVLHNLVRGCNPWPLAFFEYGGKRIKVLRAHPADGNVRPGEILSANPLTICCGEGALVLEHVVPEGAKAMGGTEWAMGRRFKAGDSIL